MKKFIYILIIMLATVIVEKPQVAANGDVYSEQCRIVQLNAQNLVESAISNEKANKAKAIAEHTVKAAKIAGVITKACAKCITKQFKKKRDINDLVPCGPDPEPECGDGILEPGEQCDDGDSDDGDGCSAACIIEPDPSCGNGILEQGEECDDGNNTDGDDCDSNCLKETTACITCEGTLSLGGRWCDNDDGTVKDMTTGLVWLKNASWGGQRPWRRDDSPDCSESPHPCYDDAHARAGLLYAGASGTDLSDGSVVGDWRLPTKSELVGITQGTEYVSSSNIHFTGVQSEPYRYWSSTTLDSLINHAWAVRMSDGEVDADNKNSNITWVWPVRPDN